MVGLVWFMVGLETAARRPTSTTKQSQGHWWKPFFLLWTQNQKSIMDVFLTDALSFIQPLANNKLPHLAKLCNYSATAEWSFSGHSPIEEFLESSKQTNSQRKVLMWATEKMPPLPKRVWCQVKRMMPTTFFSRSDQVMMVRLKTGHIPMKAHMNTKLKLVPWATCPCVKEVHHLLCHYRINGNNEKNSSSVN